MVEDGYFLPMTVAFINAVDAVQFGILSSLYDVV